MSKFKIQVTKIYKATRRIEIDVEAGDVDGAVEILDSEEREIPAFNDPTWRTEWELENEDIRPAPLA